MRRRETGAHRKKSRFVADGYNRARRANVPAIRAEVEQELAAELQTASVWQRFVIRRRMTQEIQRRLDKAAPPDALY